MKPINLQAYRMGLFNTARVAFLFAFLILLALPSAALARPPMGIPLTGTVQSVNHTTRVIGFAQDDGTAQCFVYAERAKFWHNAADASPACLKPGMKLQVRLHNPLFGPNYVSHIVLISPSPDVDRETGE